MIMGLSTQTLGQSGVHQTNNHGNGTCTHGVLQQRVVFVSNVKVGDICSVFIEGAKYTSLAEVIFSVFI